MTVSKCVAFCRGKSYQVAGLQVSSLVPEFHSIRVKLHWRSDFE